MQENDVQIYHHHHHQPEETVADEKTQGPWLYILEKHVGSLASVSLLDVGCGHGALMATCHRLGAFPVGVDPSHVIREVTREGTAQAIGQPLPLVCADGRALPFKAGLFDVVVSIGVLEHVTRPSVLVEEMVRVLKPAGILLLFFGPNRRLRFAQSSDHRGIVLSYWTPADAEQVLHALQMTSIRRVWADVVEYRFRHNLFMFGGGSWYHKLAKLFVVAAQKSHLSFAAVLACRVLETISLQRSVHLIATKKREVSQPEHISLGTNHFMGMNKDFVDILACPSCKSELELTAEKVTDNEIISGSLYCPKCDSKYPIVDAIPQFLGSVP